MLILKQCELKGECNIRLMSNGHILIRTINMEDYVNLLSKTTFYITNRNWSYPWELWSVKLYLIRRKKHQWFFLSLSSNFFGKESIFSLTAAVRKPLQVDLATRNQTRPSCTRVKVDLGQLQFLDVKLLLNFIKLLVDFLLILSEILTK